MHTWIALEPTFGDEVGDFKPQTCGALEPAGRWIPLLDEHNNVAPWANPQIISCCTFLQNKLTLIGRQELIRDLVKYWERHFSMSLLPEGNSRHNSHSLRNAQSKVSGDSGAFYCSGNCKGTSRRETLSTNINDYKEMSLTVFEYILMFHQLPRNVLFV